MSDIKKFLEAVDKFSFAGEKAKPKQVPGDQVRGTDKATARKDNKHPFAGKLVGGCEESIIKDLHNTAKEKVTEWSLQEKFNKFKEEESNTAYTGIDPIVRNRMGMQPATQDEIRTYLDKNPPVVRSGSGEPLKTGTGQNVQSGGQVAVGKAADLASPDRAQAVAKEPAAVAPAPATTAPVAPAATVAPVTAPQVSTSTVAPDANKPAVPATPAPVKPTPAKVPTMPIKTAPGSWQDIWKQNPDLKNPNLIRPGQQIKLPNGTYAIVDKGDTLSGIAKRYRQGGYNDGTEVKNTVVPGKSAPGAGSVRESDDEKIGGRYDPDEFDELVRRVGQKAKEQERKHGPVDIAKLAKRLRDLDRKDVKEYENAQDPNAQTTSPPDPKSSPSSQMSQQQAMDKEQAVDVATAKGTMSGLKTSLGPKVDTNALASAVTKIADQKPLSAPEATSMSALTPLIAKAAETPQTAMALKTALSNAAMLGKQGK